MTPRVSSPVVSIDPTAYVHPLAILCPPCTIGAYAIICPNATVLPFTSIPPFFYLPPGATASPPIGYLTSAAPLESITARQIGNSIYFNSPLLRGFYPTITFDQEIVITAFMRTIGLNIDQNYTHTTAYLPIHCTATARAYTPRILGK